MSASPPSSDRLLVTFDVLFRGSVARGASCLDVLLEEPLEEVGAVPRLVKNVGACRALIGSRP
jgi:hypothetical protein